jgi:hypothetical protein
LEELDYFRLNWWCKRTTAESEEEEEVNKEKIEVLGKGSDNAELQGSPVVFHVPHLYFVANSGVAMEGLSVAGCGSVLPILGVKSWSEIECRSLISSRDGEDCSL